MWNSIVMYVVIATAFGWLYMQNEYRGNKIQQLEVDLQNQKMYFDKKIQTSVFNAVVVEKKKAVMKDMKYDKSKSVSVDSTRFYLK